MLRIALAAALTLSAATAYAQFNGCAEGICPNGLFGPAFRAPGSSVPLPTGSILMVDGVSFILQTDAASKICIAGGC